MDIFNKTVLHHWRLCPLLRAMYIYFFIYILNDTSNATDNSFCYNFKTIQDMGMRLLHDGATSHTARKTVNLLQANRVSVLAIQITDLNRIDHILFHILDVISCVVRRRCLANVIQFEQCKVWVEGYIVTYLYAARGFDA